MLDVFMLFLSLLAILVLSGYQSYFIAMVYQLLFGILLVTIVLRSLYWSKQTRLKRHYRIQWWFLNIATFLFVAELFSGGIIGKHYFRWMQHPNFFGKIVDFLGNSPIYIYLSTFLLAFTFLGLLLFQGAFIARGKYWLQKIIGKNPTQEEYSPPLKPSTLIGITITSFIITQIQYLDKYGPLNWLGIFDNPMATPILLIFVFNVVVGVALKFLLWAWNKLKSNTKTN